MLTAAAIVFALAAVAGLALALRVLRQQLAPWPLSLLHALLGAVGLIVLALAVFQSPGNTLLVAALLGLVVAALGGFFLASFHVRKRLPPSPVVAIHAAVAVAGFALLLFVAFLR